MIFEKESLIDLNHFCIESKKVCFNYLWFTMTEIKNSTRKMKKKLDKRYFLKMKKIVVSTLKYTYGLTINLFFQV